MKNSGGEKGRDGERKEMWRRETIEEEDGRFHARIFFFFKFNHFA